MLTADSLKAILCQPLSNTQRLLICLAVDKNRPKPTSEIKQLAIKGGLNEARKWNISDYLAKSRAYVVRSPDGWSLTLQGKKYVEELIKPYIKKPITKLTTDLRSHLPKITDPDTRAFLEEAIGCCEASFWRAAVVLSWAGAVSVLYDHVLQHKLADFNKEALRKNPDWKTAKTKDHLARMKESDFLATLQAISVLDKNVRQELVHCLELRNACGHPSSLQIGEHRTAAHLEMLILNVFTKFMPRKEALDLSDLDKFLAEAAKVRWPFGSEFGFPLGEDSHKGK